MSIDKARDYLDRATENVGVAGWSSAVVNLIEAVRVIDAKLSPAPVGATRPKCNCTPDGRARECDCDTGPGFTPPAATSDGGEALAVEVKAVNYLKGRLAQVIKQREEAERQRDDATALVERLRGRVEALEAGLKSTTLGLISLMSLVREAHKKHKEPRLAVMSDGAFERTLLDNDARIREARALLSEPQASEGRDG